MLVVRRQRELFAQVLERLVDGEPGTDRCDLEQDAARLAEVDRAEVEAVDDRRWMRTARAHALVPRRVLVLRRGPGDVVHRACTLVARLRGRFVVCIEGA